LSKLSLLDTSVWARLRDGRLTGRSADRLFDSVWAARRGSIS
jgi:hypothetical protein